MKQLKSGLLTLVILLVFLPRELRAQFYVNNALVFSPASVCEGDSVSISYFQTNASPFTWTLNGGVSPINQDTISIFISGGLPDTILVQGVGVNPSVVDTLILNIGIPSVPTLQVSPKYLCHDDPPTALSGGLPVGGYFTGPAITGGLFNPSFANPGWNIVQYNVVGPQGCVGTVVDSVFVNGPFSPSVFISGGPGTTLTQFNGIDVWYDCDIGASSSATLFPTFSQSGVASYSIDFGDGTPPITGTGTPPTTISHTYPQPGLYTGTMTAVSDSGCTTITNLNYFFGSNPQIGFSTPGSTAGCLEPGDSLTFTFPISNFSGNVDGTIYQLEYNDGRPTETFVHPPPTSVTRSFYSPSCGASPQGATPNTFFIRIIATNPCGASSITAEPIVISNRPRSQFFLNDTACVDNSVAIIDQTVGGSSVPSSGGACDTTHKIIWKISPSSFTVLGSGSLGTQPGGSLNPSAWTTGSDNLDVEFNSPGVYTITQLVGIGGVCGIDSSTQVICVQEGLDTASIHAEAFGSTSCSPSSYRLSVDSQLNSFCEPNDFLWSITPNFFTVDSGSVTGSAIRVTFNTSGEYIVNLTAQNSCSSVVVSDTIRVTSAPFIQFVDTAFYCEPDTADFFFDPEHLPAFNDGLDSVSFQYTISPATGWSVVSGALNQQNPSIYFGNPGVYAVSATAMNSCGMDSDVQTVVVQPPTVVNLNLQDSVCSGASVSITANPSGGTPPFTFQWSTPNQQFTGDSVFLSGIVQSVPFTLAVTDSLGCVTQIDSAVHVLPTLQFVGSGFSICQTDTVQSSFSMNGGTPPFQFSWSSGIGLSDSTLLNPFFYGSTALSSYDLTVTDARGCSITETVSVSITSAPPANAGPDIQACIGDSITLAQGTVPGSFNYEWTNALGVVVDTVPSPTVLVTTSSSSYILKVFSSTNCFAYDTVLVSADPVPSSSFTLPGDTLCLNTGITLTDTNSNVATREWRRNGVLIGTSSLQVDSLVNTSPSYTQWVYSLRTVGASGCESTSYDTVYINPSSGLGVISSPVCFGDSMSFAASFLPGTNLSNFVWDFGDNTQATGSSVSHLYASPGSYTVQLSATDNEGCTQIAIDTVSVALLPIVNFQLTSNCSADTVCLNNPYSFTDLTTSPSGAPITQWSWDFDADGVEDTNVQNPVYTFTTSGPQTVTLASTTSSGCASSFSRTYFVQDPLMAFVQLDEDSICGPYALNDTSWTSGQVDSFLWELYRFDDQLNRIVVFSSTSPNPSLPTAPAPVGGTYNWIWALSISNCCETVQSFDTVRVSSIAVPNFVVSPDSGCTPLNSSFQFDGLIQGTPDSLFLDFGDGQLDTLTPTPIWTNGQVQYQWGQVLHQYNYSGNGDTTYYPSVRISNGCGDSTLAMPVFVQVNSVQSFFNPSSSSGCAPLNVTFDNLSFGGTQYNWCFDFDTITGQCQGATSNDSLPNYTYGQPGTYVARLIVNNGCSYDTSFQVVDVQTGINTTLQTPAQACVGDTVSVSALVSAPGTALSYEWSFGNGQSDNSLNAATVYDSAGTFIVSLVSLTTDGCRDSSFTSITILPSPEVHFGFVAGCFGQQPVAFFDSSSTSSGTITGTVWDFGDGNSSTQINPTHTYANPGTYLVRLTKFNSLGCSAFTEINVIVHPDPLLDFQYTLLNLDSCGLPQSYQFNNLSQQSSGYVWDFDFANPGQLTSTLNSPTHTYDSVGTYVVALIGENAFGCSDTITQSILVRPALTALFSVNPQSACEGTVFSFSDLSLQDSTFDPVTGWEWDFGDGTTTSGSPNVQHVYSQTGVYTAQLNVTTGLGCSDNAYTITVEVLERPVADFIVQEQTLTEVQFTNLSQDLLGGAVFSWDFGDGAISAQESPSHNYGEPGTFPVILITLNPNGCSDTIASDVTIEDLFRVYIPTAFTPNGDGKNEIFYIQGTGIDQMHLEIYDRWGKMIFESRDPSVGWDGTMPNGNLAKQDNYHYRLQVENILLKEIINRSGVITLVR